MDEKTAPATRRAILGVSAIGVYAAATATSRGKAADAPAGDIAPTLRVMVDRAALAAHRDIGLGTRVVLAEPLRGGTFVARPRSLHQGEVVADPYQAFCVASSVDRNVVWVRDFTGPASLDWGGAKGDGKTDDAPFINAMLQNSFVSWFQVEDRRNHRLGAPLRIRRAIKLTGAGALSSTFTVDTPIDAIDVAMRSASDHGLQLADIGIVNAMASGTPTAGSGVRLDLTYLAKLSNIRVVNCWNGVHSTRSGLTNMDAIRIDAAINAGFLFDGGLNFDTRITGFTISGGGYAIRLQDMCDELIFADGVCSSAQYALYSDASANAVNQRPEFCRFARVSFDSCAHGIDLAHCADFVFDACFVSCRPHHGAEIGVRGPVENIQFVATTFFNNARSAAVVGPGAADTDFLACKFISNATAKPGADDALVFAAGCGSFSLAQSRFRQGWGVASTPRYQVSIAAGGAEDYALTGNRFAAGTAGTVSDERRGRSRSIFGNFGI